MFPSIIISCSQVQVQYKYKSLKWLVVLHVWEELCLMAAIELETFYHSQNDKELTGIQIVIFSIPVSILKAIKFESW